MRKFVFSLILILTMAGSIVAGTLAMYTTSIDNLAEGSVVAKEFVFVGEGTDSFRQGVKIAPSETVRWQFKVKNYEDHVITETDLFYKLTFNVAASAGKSAIAPLTVTVKDLQGNVLNSVTGVGAFDVLGSFPLSENGQERDYVVELHWPSNDSVDINYAGGDYGTTVNVDAAASQMPFDGQETENPPQRRDIGVRYETTVSWQNGQSGINEYQYKITITNNSDQAIRDWYIAFSLPTDRLTGVWNAKLAPGYPEGSYKIVNPGYNNQTTDDILPGQSISFGGPARGRGTEPIRDISVGGSNTGASSNVDLTCEFGKPSLG
jgi:hypothetical protein